MAAMDPCRPHTRLSSRGALTTARYALLTVVAALVLLLLLPIYPMTARYNLHATASPTIFVQHQDIGLGTYNHKPVIDGESPEPWRQHCWEMNKIENYKLLDIPRSQFMLHERVDSDECSNESGSYPQAYDDVGRCIAFFEIFEFWCPGCKIMIETCTTYCVDVDEPKCYDGANCDVNDEECWQTYGDRWYQVNDLERRVQSSESLRKRVRREDIAAPANRRPSPTTHRHLNNQHDPVEKPSVSAQRRSLEAPSRCWESSLTSGDSVLSKNCIANPNNGAAPFNIATSAPVCGEAALQRFFNGGQLDSSDYYSKHSGEGKTAPSIISSISHETSTVVPRLVSLIPKRDLTDATTQLNPIFAPQPHIPIVPKLRPKRHPAEARVVKGFTKLGLVRSTEGPVPFWNRHRPNQPSPDPKRGITGASTELNELESTKQDLPSSQDNGRSQHACSKYGKCGLCTDNDKVLRRSESEVSQSKATEEADPPPNHFVCDVSGENDICAYGHYEWDRYAVRRSELSESDAAKEDLPQSPNHFVCDAYDEKDICTYGHYEWDRSAAPRSEGHESFPLAHPSPQRCHEGSQDSRCKDFESAVLDHGSRSNEHNGLSLGNPGGRRPTEVIHAAFDAAVKVRNSIGVCLANGNTDCTRRTRILYIAVALGVVSLGLLLIAVLDKIRRAKARRSKSLTSIEPMTEPAPVITDGPKEGWTGWFSQQHTIVNRRNLLPTPHNFAPRIPSLTLPKPTLATVRKFSGLDPDLENGERGQGKSCWKSDSKSTTM